MSCFNSASVGEYSLISTSPVVTVSSALLGLSWRNWCGLRAFQSSIGKSIASRPITFGASGSSSSPSSTMRATRLTASVNCSGAISL
ncbi:hypothetical protein D3C80_1706360 [compost metagenome]